MNRVFLSLVLLLSYNCLESMTAVRALPRVASATLTYPAFWTGLIGVAMHHAPATTDNDRKLGKLYLTFAASYSCMDLLGRFGMLPMLDLNNNKQLPYVLLYLAALTTCAFKGLDYDNPDNRAKIRSVAWASGIAVLLSYLWVSISMGK